MTIPLLPSGFGEGDLRRLLAGPVVRAALAGLVFLVASALYGLSSDVAVSLGMSTTTKGQGEVFYAERTQPYAQARSIGFLLRNDGREHAYEVKLPPGYRTHRIRIDPGNGPGTIEVGRVEVRSGRYRMLFEGTQLKKALGITHHLEARYTPKGLAFASTGRDPYFEINLRKGIGGKTAIAEALSHILFGLAIAAAWLVVEFCFTKARRRIRLPRASHTLVNRICRVSSDRSVLEVNGRILLSVFMLCLLALVYVGLGLNQSSLGWWENIYPYQPVEQAVDLGTAKRIRSDEWSVQAPWVLNQVKAGAPLHNPNVGADYSPLIASLPVSGIAGLPHLKFAGFRFLSIERGVSWWWAYKSFALVFSFLWLFLLLTRGNLPASLVGAAWIYASSFVQWWLSSNLPEIMIAFALGVAGAIYALFSEKRGLIALGCGLVAYAASNLALNLYPPFIVPLGYLGIAILAGFAVQTAATNRTRSQLLFRSGALALTAILCGAYLLYFKTVASDTIAAMLETVYPGQRVADSGGVPFAKAFYGYFEAFRFSELHFPPMSTNASEASSFVLLFPLILLAIPLRSMFRHGNALLLAIACMCVLTLSWLMFDLPSPIERILQAMGWSLVTPKRAVLGLGVASILASIVLFAQVQNGGGVMRSRDARHMAITTLFACLLAFGWGLRQFAPDFFSWQVIAAGTIASGLLGAGILTGRTALLFAGVAVYALPTLAVNPLVSGISALSEKPILVVAERHSALPGAKWAVIGDPVLAQGLKAHGLQVFGGTRFLPEPADLAILDPQGRYERIWNRYATIYLKSTPDAKSPRFKRKRGDQYWISLNVCGDRLQELGVDHLAYTVAVPASDLECLTELPTVEASGVKLFRYRSQRPDGPSDRILRNVPHDVD